MHELINSCTPPINYDLDKTQDLKNKIKILRAEGLNIYFTQDAGPNIKLLFLEKDINEILKIYPDLQIIKPFA